MDQKTARAIISMTPAQNKLLSDKATLYVKQLQAIKRDLVANPVLKEMLFLKTGVTTDAKTPEESISKIIKNIK